MPLSLSCLLHWIVARLLCYMPRSRGGCRRSYSSARPLPRSWLNPPQWIALPASPPSSPASPDDRQGHNVSRSMPLLSIFTAGRWFLTKWRGATPDVAPMVDGNGFTDALVVLLGSHAALRMPALPPILYPKSLSSSVMTFHGDVCLAHGCYLYPICV